MSVLCTRDFVNEPCLFFFFLSSSSFLHFSVECYLLSDAELENTQSPHQTISWYRALL
jgi:hypothetical protein